MYKTNKKVAVVGGGLAGCEAALKLAKNGVDVTLFEMRPGVNTPVHKTEALAELVCSNSLKSLKPNSAAGMLKHELEVLGSELIQSAFESQVDAGGALAVDRDAFASAVTRKVEAACEIKREEITDIAELRDFDAAIIATGPMTSEKFTSSLKTSYLNFYDAAAPIVEAATLNHEILFSQNRYEDNAGDYLNAPFEKAEYEAFITELLAAQRVVLKDFETKELFQACQPIEEIARKGKDAPRYGCLKPVGLTNPATGRRPWAAVQLRAENEEKTAYNLVGFQTNLTFPEQKRVFRMIPGLENAEFSRYGVMHKNLFLNAPAMLDSNLLCTEFSEKVKVPVYVAGQFSGTEGYCEAIRSGLHAAISVLLDTPPKLSRNTVFGALIDYATNPSTNDYQPMHVNFGILPPLEKHIKNKQERYEQYRLRAEASLAEYVSELKNRGVK